MQRQLARRLTLAVLTPLLLTSCGGDDEPQVLPEVKAFDDARDALVAADAGRYDWYVEVKAFPKPLIDDVVCWDDASGDPPPPEDAHPEAVEAIAKAEAYGAFREDASLVDVDIPAALALTLLGVEDKILAKSPLEPEDLAPAVVGVEDGRITTLKVNGAAVARRLSDDDVPVDADLRSHADLAVAHIEFGPAC
ncbi:MAG TPA: hypothetical protein VFK52_03065 [Nocardioidaceae bacterium]|nr:hypothetical protein [Nocardioidaceae bacterium]